MFQTEASHSEAGACGVSGVFWTRTGAVRDFVAVRYRLLYHSNVFLTRFGKASLTSRAFKLLRFPVQMLLAVRFPRSFVEDASSRQAPAILRAR